MHACMPYALHRTVSSWAAMLVLSSLVHTAKESNNTHACMQEYIKQNGLDHIPIEVETRTLKEVQEVLDLTRADASLRVDRIMLDNMTRLDPSQPGRLALTQCCHSQKPASQC